jgi:hypothetical protein
MNGLWKRKKDLAVFFRQLFLSVGRISLQTKENAKSGG